MRMRSTICGFVLLFAAAHASARPATESPEACQLLTAAEVAAVQGEALVRTTPSTQAGRSQCFFQVTSFVNSVSLDVMPTGGRAFWEENFEEPREEEGEEHEEKTPPRPIKGVGAEAFWVGNRNAGSLYVLDHDRVLRVSVGGGASEADKIERSKKLAAKALRKL